MKYAYQRGGAPILDWSRGAPRQSRAADTVALGSLAGSSLDDPTLVLPAPGAPEPIGMAGCSCTGTCGCTTSGALGALGDLADSIPGGYVTLGIAALVAWKLLHRKR